MRVLVTGATGFVMSVLVRALLDSSPRVRVTALDLSSPDDLHVRYLGPGSGRVRAVRADVRDAAAVRTALEPGVDLVVHGATVTHSASAERADPGRYLDVNVGGTVAVLDAVRAVTPMPRLLYLSSGAVYGTDRSWTPRPVETYGISKLAAESVVRRFGELFGVRAVVVRPAKVYGAMERPTGARTAMSVPYLLARAAVRGTALRVSERTLDAACDWVAAPDVAAALLALAGGVFAGTYDVGSGVRTPFAVLAEAASGWCGRSVVEVNRGSSSDLDLDPDERWGKDDAHPIDRVVADTGWRPRPVVERFVEYLDWAAEHPAVFETQLPSF